MWRVFRHLGERVQAGEVLALIDAAEVGKAKAELLQAVAAQTLKGKVLASKRSSAGSVAGAVIEEAEAEVGIERDESDEELAEAASESSEGGDAEGESSEGGDSDKE